jgi:hypothetical protein
VNPERAKERNKDIKDMNRERRRNGKVKIQREVWRCERTCRELATVFIRRVISKTSYTAINVLVYIISENMEIPCK